MTSNLHRRKFRQQSLVGKISKLGVRKQEFRFSVITHLPKLEDIYWDNSAMLNCFPKLFLLHSSKLAWVNRDILGGLWKTEVK